MEQVDDIPVLLAQGKKIGVPELQDQHFWLYGNWQGTRFGWTVMEWLGYILSEGGQRLNQMGQWIEKHTQLVCGFPKSAGKMTEP